IAIFRAGAAYLPIASGAGGARLERLAAHASVDLALADAPRLEEVRTLSARALTLDMLFEASERASPFPGRASLTGLAYVIPTSGSTGEPKGVMVHHLGIANLVRAMTETWPLDETSRVLQFASLGFDASVPEWAGPLSVGGRIVLKPQSDLLVGDRLRDFVADKGLTFIKMPSAVLRTVSTAPLPSVRTIVTAGDACTDELVERWARGRRFFNCYGPTEVSIGSTMARLTPGADVTIGAAHPNLSAIVLDATLSPTPPGAVGELYMGGIGVSWGYVGQPGLTADRFVPDPFSKSPGARLYRTGDLVRIVENGELAFEGRIDDQVKIRGFRIELGDVERAMLSHSSVEQAAAVAENETLIGFYTASSPVDASALSDHLAARLPRYMTPNRLIALPSMPLTVNGKVDRKALLARVRTDGVFALPKVGGDLATIARIWAKHLRCDIPVRASFVELGGDSVTAAKIAASIGAALGRPPTPRDVIECRNILDLAIRSGVSVDDADIAQLDDDDIDALLRGLENETAA
ncbi:MAG: non-ribosomal peptide synthetase, partial [Pseudomonadota bacterium]